jgi:serine/threonine protein kinase/tetratricopeptide (TPR) repeat protein
MGEVYRAEDTTLDREVALKILPPELAESQERLDRFQREAKTLAALNHPNIVHVYTVEEDEGTHFLTMELVEGKSLSQLIPKGGMPLERIFEIAIPLADALATAHEKGVIHRDLKPANIMVTDEDRVKVLDFGLAKLRQEAETPLASQAPTEPLTEEGKIVGTMPFMSPEQLEGKEVDARSDIFSLGVVLYEMATGDRPFKGDSAASLITAIMSHSPREVDSLRAELPHHLGRIIRRCLEKDPRSRYQSALDVHNELKDLNREESSSAVVPAAPAPDPEPTRKPVKWPLVATAMAGAVVILTILVALWLGRSQTPTEAPTEPPAEPAAAVEAKPPMIVVLPFENLGDPEDEYFADGMTEEITSRLAVVSGLRVISRTSAMQYKTERPPMRQIGEELGVDYVLEGTVRWARTEGGHGRVRITPQLIRIEDDIHLWADSYDRVIEDIFDVQASIAKNVIYQLAVTLLESEEAEQKARPTQNIEAYQAYLRALYLDHQTIFIRSHLEAVVREFARAVEFDSEFAEAYAGLAAAHAGMIHHGIDTSEERREASRQAAERALALAPDSPRVLDYIGTYHYRGSKDWDAALEYYQRAAQALPSDSDPIEGIAIVQQRLGLWEQALKNLRKAIALNPRDSPLRSVLCLYLRSMRQYEEAVQYCDQSIELEPNQIYAYRIKAIAYLLWKGDTRQARTVWQATPIEWPFRSLRDLLLLDRDYQEILERLDSEEDTWFKEQMYAYPWELERAQVLLLTGEEELAREAFEQARRDLEEELAKSPNDHRLNSALGIAYAGLGQREKAVEYGRRGVDLMPVSKDALIGDHRLHDLALIYVMVNEPELAVDQLETLLTIPSCYSASWYRLDPRMDPLRDDLRFQALLEKYG